MIASGVLFAALPGHATDPPPEIDAITIADYPRDGLTFRAGEEIELLLEFDVLVRVDSSTAVTTDPPTLALQLGDGSVVTSTWRAIDSEYEDDRYYIAFVYVVQPFDRAEYLSLPPAPLDLKGWRVLIDEEGDRAGDPIDVAAAIEAYRPETDFNAAIYDDDQLFGVAGGGIVVRGVAGVVAGEPGRFTATEDDGAGGATRITLIAEASTFGEVDYEWRVEAGPALAGASAESSRYDFTLPNRTAGYELVLMVTATDDEDVSTSTAVRIQVDADDDPPQADAGSDQLVLQGAMVTLDGTASRDPEGEALTWAWTYAPPSAGITLNDATISTPSFTAPENGPLDLTFTLTVSDGVGATSSDAITVLVRERLPVDANADDAVNAQDALILYYAFSLRSELGNGR